MGREEQVAAEEPCCAEEDIIWLAAGPSVPPQGHTLTAVSRTFLPFLTMTTFPCKRLYVFPVQERELETLRGEVTNLTALARPSGTLDSLLLL